jgi:hypothetical protein
VIGLAAERLHDRFPGSDDLWRDVHVLGFVSAGVGVTQVTVGRRGSVVGSISMLRFDARHPLGYLLVPVALPTGWRR